MRIDKNSGAWAAAPWYVKFSALGIKSVSGVRLWKNVSFFAGVVACVLGLIGVVTGLVVLSYLFPFSVLGLSACWYWFALDWFRDNPAALITAEPESA